MYEMYNNWYVKSPLKTHWYKMCENRRFENPEKFFFCKMFETLPGSLKDENIFLKRELGRVFQYILIPRPAHSQKN
jgi:hypothetical protein